METFEGLMGLIAIVAIIVLIGFAITLLVGFSGKLLTVKRIGVIGTIVAGGILLVSGGLAYGTDVYVQHQNEQADKEFNKQSAEFRSEYVSIWGLSEDVGNDVQDKWETAIDNSLDDDGDFDPTDTITMAVNDNEDNISDIDKDVKKLEGTYALLKANNTGTYDFKAYKKAYKEIKNYADFVSDPSGSYYSFDNGFSKHDNNAKRLFKNLTD